MAGESNELVRQEFRRDFRLAVYQLLQIIQNEFGEGQHGIRPDNKEWRIQRAKTIEKLLELIDQLDKTCVLASYGKGVGIGAEVAGEITSIIAALMTLSESPSADTLMKVGNLLTHSGSLLEATSNAAESLFSAKYLKEIEEVLEKDRELSKPLQHWLAFSRNLNANVREIFGCDLNFAIQNNVLKVFSEFAMLHRRCRSFQQTINTMRSGNFSLDIDVNVPVERLLNFSSQLETYPEVYDNLNTICSTLSNSGRIIQTISEGVRVCRNLFGDEEMNSGTDPRSHQGRLNNLDENDKVAEDSLRLRIKRDRESPPVREVSTFCAFQTINIALNVFHLSRNIMAIKDGKSKYSDALRQILNLLTMELRSMENF